MQEGKSAAQARLDVGWFVVGALVAILAHAAAAVGATSGMGPLSFDYPLRLAEIAYGARGLTPYSDFGFVYPPGHVWFYGKLLRLENPGSINIAVVLCNLLLWSICAWLIMRLAPRLRWWLGGTVLLVLGGLIPWVDGATSGALWEPLPLLLIAVLLIFEVMQRGPSPQKLAVLVAVAAAGALCRWDWIPMTAVLEIGWASTMWLIGRRLKSDQDVLGRQTVTRLLYAGLAALAGAALAFAAVAGVTAATDTGVQARFFIFYLPAYIVKYRHLPLSFDNFPAIQLLQAILGIALVCVSALFEYVKARKWSGRVSLLTCGALVAPCLAMLPYSVGRMDEIHIVPIVSVAIATSIAAFAFYSYRASRRLLMLAVALNGSGFVVLALVLLPVVGMRMKTAGLHFDRVRSATAACTRMFPGDARSLFVGQVSYDRFYINAANFYTIHPELRPASPFISDEPGVQNSCALGSRIAEDLLRAPRPLVMVLDTTHYDPEIGLRRPITSCGKIEAAMAAMPAVELGSCYVPADPSSNEGRTFRVMLAR